jgi:phosphoglycolate phosphatase-like HAD superfamily hydrolase
MVEIIERIAALEASATIAQQTQNDIKGWMMKRADQHIELMGKLATIEEVNRGTKEYQQQCEKERQEQSTALAIQGNEITGIKKDLGWYNKIGLGLAACVSLVITTGVELFKK